MIQGQEILCNLIDSLPLNKLPRSLMLEGARGSGKHLIVNYIASKYHMETLDISSMLKLESLELIADRKLPTLYIIDIDNENHELSIKEQNIILKFIEEPSASNYIILLTTSKHRYIETVRNRCQIWTLSNYTKTQLRNFLDANNPHNDLILSLAKTPGDILELNTVDIQSIIDLAKKLIEKIHLASFPNTLSISSKIAFKNEKNLINYDFFIDSIILILVDKIKSGNNSLYEFYILTQKLKSDSKIAYIDRKLLFENYLSQLWVVARK